MKTESVVHDIAALHSSVSDACILLRILANEDRLFILCEQGTRNVGELEELLGIHQPTLLSS